MMRNIAISLMLVLGVAAGAVAQPARSGEQVYTQICARCHESGMPQILTAAPIQEYTAARIYEALTFGFMVRQAAGLSKAEMRAVAEFVSGSPAGSLSPTRGSPVPRRSTTDGCLYLSHRSRK